MPESEFWDPFTSGALNKYSPFSMLNELRFAFDKEFPYAAEELLVEGNQGSFADYQLHVKGGVSRERGIERREEVRELYRTGLAQSRVVIITLGMIEAWFDHELELFVNDAPSYQMVQKHPERFSFEVARFEALLTCITDMIELIRNVRKDDVKIVMTVSPVPFARTFSGQDAIVANTYSKSVLRAVAGQIAEDYADVVDYFPSYESVTLSDPDWTWQDDQLHVQIEPIRMNVTRMVEAYCPQLFNEKSG